MLQLPVKVNTIQFIDWYFPHAVNTLKKYLTGLSVDIPLSL
ncbi:UNVERIFIED_CONTAM: hypothetical protein GTU68_022276 [Idotea baltica]|nr:hypothetical protein [Idotea baltica]